MDTRLMNSRNSERSAPHRLLLKLSDKMKLKGSDKYVALSNLNIYYAQIDIKKIYKNNNFKIPAPMWNQIFELLDGSSSVSDIEDYFDYVIKKHETMTDKPPNRNISN